MESEKTTEKYLCEKVEEIGGFAYKWVSPNRIGVPDRILIFPYSFIMFVEVKSEGKPLDPPQVRELERLADKGMIIAVVDTKAQVDRIIKNIKASQQQLKRLSEGQPLNEEYMEDK